MRESTMGWNIVRNQSLQIVQLTMQPLYFVSKDSNVSRRTTPFEQKCCNRKPNRHVHTSNRHSNPKPLVPRSPPRFYISGPTHSKVEFQDYYPSLFPFGSVPFLDFWQALIQHCLCLYAAYGRSRMWLGMRDGGCACFFVCRVSY